jgi:hypothetical protein
MYQPFLHTDSNRGMMMLRVRASDDPRSVDAVLVRQRLLATVFAFVVVRRTREIADERRWVPNTGTLRGW